VTKAIDAAERTNNGQTDSDLGDDLLQSNHILSYRTTIDSAPECEVQRPMSPPSIPPLLKKCLARAGTGRIQKPGLKKKPPLRRPFGNNASPRCSMTRAYGCDHAWLDDKKGLVLYNMGIEVVNITYDIYLKEYVSRNTQCIVEMAMMAALTSCYRTHRGLAIRLLRSTDAIHTCKSILCSKLLTVGEVMATTDPPISRPLHQAPSTDHLLHLTLFCRYPPYIPRPRPLQCTYLSRRLLTYKSWETHLKNCGDKGGLLLAFGCRIIYICQRRRRNRTYARIVPAIVGGGAPVLAASDNISSWPQHGYKQGQKWRP